MAMLKEITIEEFRKKHHSEYEEVLLRLGLDSLDRMVLKVTGTKALKIYSIRDRRFYSCLSDANVKTIVKREVFGNMPEEKGTERYVLTISVCEQPITYDSLKVDYDDLFHEHLEYALLIRDRKAWFGLISMETKKFEASLIRLFLNDLGKLINVDATCIQVPISESVLLQALMTSGYSIGKERAECYNVIKGHIEDLNIKEACLTNLLNKP
jgi:hypothetical protein